MFKRKNQNGITLIALIITIIILLILAGVTISVLTGDSGLLSTTKRAGEEYTKAQLKEELEIEIVNIQSEKIGNREKISREDLWELEKIGAIMISVETPAEGEYKDYNFTVDENYVVTIEGKNNAIKPKIELTKDTEEIVEEVTIKVKITTEDGTIISVTKPDGTTTTDTEFEYKVKENKTYRFVARGSNGSKAVENIKITNVKIVDPIIESNYGYPVLKSTGIIIGDSVSITFDNTEGLENYYSIDNGVTWTKYTGTFSIDNPVEVMAKSVRNDVVLSQSSKNIVVPTDALGSAAYDDDPNNCVSGGKGMTDSFCFVDQSVIGKKVRIKLQSWTLSYCYAYFRFVYADKTEEVKLGIPGNSMVDEVLVIPENVIKLKFSTQTNSGVFEVKLVN